MLALRLLHEDEDLVVIDKPAGFHTHPPEDKSVRVNHRWNALGILEKQLGRKLYPAHRLDRATSGLLVYSKARELNHALQSQFAENSVAKTYYCLVRGQLTEELRLDRPLRNEAGNEVPALTIITPLYRFTQTLADREGRYTLVRAEPKTGRFHQIRRHLAGAKHPILGDKTHGDRKGSRAFAEATGLDGLFLRCMELRFRHPRTGAEVRLRNRWSRQWHELFARAGLCPLA